MTVRNGSTRASAIRRAGVNMLVAVLLIAYSVALAQSGNFGFPAGGPSGDQGEAGAPGADAGESGCSGVENLAQLPPAAGKVAGEAAQAGNSTFVMMTQGRKILGRSMDETGDTEQALRQIRDEAAFRSLACSSDKDYRMGVCYTFTLQCLAHGGGNCDSCGRQWGNLFCKETLKKTVKDTVPKPEDVFGDDSEWPGLISVAEEVADSTLVDDLNGFREDVLNGAVDGPVDELCDSYFYPSA